MEFVIIQPNYHVTRSISELDEVLEIIMLIKERPFDLVSKRPLAG
jgi:hypothetical protein